MEKDSKLRQILDGLLQDADRNTDTDTYNHDTPYSLHDILKKAAQPSPE